MEASVCVGLRSKTVWPQKVTPLTWNLYHRLLSAALLMVQVQQRRPPQTVLVAIREIQVVKLQQTLWLNTLKWAKVSQRNASSKRSKAKWRRPEMMRDASMTLAGVSSHHAHWWICTHVELNWNLSNALNCWAAAISADLWYLSRLWF